MSLKDRIEEWCFDESTNSDGYGVILSNWPEPLVVTQQELFYCIQHLANGPLVHTKGKTILKIDGFEVHFKVLDFNDYLKQIENANIYSPE